MDQAPGLQHRKSEIVENGLDTKIVVVVGSVADVDKIELGGDVARAEDGHLEVVVETAGVVVDERDGYRVFTEIGGKGREGGV